MRELSTNDGVPFGGRQCAEAKRALENLRSDGSVIYGDKLAIMNMPKDVRALDVLIGGKRLCLPSDFSLENKYVNKN